VSYSPKWAFSGLHQTMYCIAGEIEKPFLRLKIFIVEKIIHIISMCMVTSV